MSESNSPKPEEPVASEHLNIKVTDNNNEVFFKIKRTTALKKLMDAFCDRSGKSIQSVRFLFDGQRVQPTDNPESVSVCHTSDWDSAAPTDTDTRRSWRCRTAIHSKSTRNRLVARGVNNTVATYRTNSFM